MFADLQGKIAVVTGGTRGIGKAIVEGLVAAGSEVIFTGTSAERGAEVAAATGARFVRADASDPLHAEIVTAAVLEAAGGLDILVNNAGVLGAAQGVAATTPEALDLTLGIHLRAPWFLMAKAVPLMRARGGGSIVNMSSVAGHRVGATSVAYSVAKAGLMHLTRCAAAEFGPLGIRVNSVSPGFVATAIHAGGMDPTNEARSNRFIDGLARLFLSRQALPRTGQPSDLASLVIFMCSDASSFITGTDIVADGGMMWGRQGLT